MGGFLNWWDGVELWLSGLGFVAQTAVVMPVVLALAYGIAILLDGALGNGIRLTAPRPSSGRGNGVTGMPRSRVTLVLVILVVLVVVMWLVTRYAGESPESESVTAILLFFAPCRQRPATRVAISWPSSPWDSRCR